ncbi:unnamed protein product [Parascedosporium putredinis]|uniref:Uncharacterized protein n=1 Tax=Parascedosporium putredinis TaxID=1442378 RepID=A0A9P1H7P1_9PEZI|nr:unnamed protein product [Parascedosporium putredinis]CAI8000042.1 unnamed protein product [Parascedosporium putredinis]
MPRRNCRVKPAGLNIAGPDTSLSCHAGAHVIHGRTADGSALTNRPEVHHLIDGEEEEYRPTLGWMRV